MSGTPPAAIRFQVAAAALGAAAAVAQVLFARELLVAFLGNELVIGLVLAVWLTGIGLGAAVCRRIGTARWVNPSSAAGVLMAVAGILMPVQVFAARVARLIVGVPTGEAGSLGSALAASAIVCVPTALIVGLAFPLLCASGDDDAADRASSPARLYGMEAAGSLLAGMALTWLLLPLRSGMAAAAIGGGLALVGGACLMRGVGALGAGALAATCVAAGALGWPVAPLESASAAARWRAAGLLVEGTALIETRDTVHQNLALLEREGQYTLYANGGIVATFPDRLASEHEIHPVMAQKTDARRVLLLGGNPLDDVRELLRYPLDSLVQVELDPAIGDMVRRAAPGEWLELAKDPRLTRVVEDLPRYLKHCDDRFDVILVKAGDPSTLAANRCFTVEFFADARRCLREGGFLATSVGLSERLQQDAATLGASVYGALRAVFPVVLVTAGARPVFLAGTETSGLTLERDVLTTRTRATGIQTKYFRPEYFLGTDDYDPEKTAFVRDRLSGTGAAANTMLRPVAPTYSLAMWRHFSGTGSWAGVWIVVLAALAAIAPAMPDSRRREGAAGGAKKGGTVGAWVVCLAVATTGLAAIALELLLILLFQSAYGYIYARISLLFAMFMAGLVLGARSGRRWSVDAARARRAIVGLELGMAALAGVVLWVQVVAGSGAEAGLSTGFAIYACILLAGWITGAEFPVAVAVLASGGAARSAVAAADAADHSGAAIGALLASILLVPLLGLGGSIAVLVAMKVSSGLLCGVCSLDRADEAGPKSLDQRV